MHLIGTETISLSQHPLSIVGRTAYWVQLASCTINTWDVPLIVNIKLFFWVFLYSAIATASLALPYVGENLALLQYPSLFSPNSMIRVASLGTVKFLSLDFQFQHHLIEGYQTFVYKITDHPSRTTGFWFNGCLIRQGPCKFFSSLDWNADSSWQITASF